MYDNVILLPYCQEIRRDIINAVLFHTGTIEQVAEYYGIEVVVVKCLVKRHLRRGK